jgi:hypothetical protein
MSMSSLDLEERSGSRRFSPDAPHAAATPFEEDTEVSLLQILNVILRYRRLLLGLPLALAVFIAAVVLLIPRQFTTTFSFMPQSSQATSGGSIAGLAAQFGVSIGNGTTQGPDFYADIMESNEILVPLALHQYTVVSGRDTITGDLIKIFDLWGSIPNMLHIRRDPNSARLQAVIDYLRANVVDITADQTSGTDLITVTTKWPELSAQIGQQLLVLVNALNVRGRSESAAAERAFMENRATVTLSELRAAENDVQNFLQHNRTYATDPQLQFEYDRLERALTLRQTVYAGVVQQLEQARITEVRNTPTIVVVQRPTPAVAPDKKRVFLKTLLALIGGLFLALGIAFVREYFKRTAHRRESDYEQFNELRAASKQDLSRIIRPGSWSRVKRLAGGIRKDGGGS